MIVQIEVDMSLMETDFARWRCHQLQGRVVTVIVHLAFAVLCYGIRAIDVSCSRPRRLRCHRPRPLGRCTELCVEVVACVWTENLILWSLLFRIALK